MSKFPIIIYDDIDTNIGYIMDIATNVNHETVNFMIKKARGLVYVCITKERAKQLGLSLMNEYSSIATKKDFTVSVDFKTTTTGISAYERADTIRAFLNADTLAKDFRRPGHVFPLISRDNGLLERKGIVETAISLAQMTMNEPVAYICEMLNIQGEVSDWSEIETFSQENGLEILTISQIVNMQLESMNWLEVKHIDNLKNYPNVSMYEIENKLLSNRFSLYVSTCGNGIDRIVYYTECMSGDLLGQGRCSCDLHFKDYFDMLIKGKINAIVLYHDKSLAFASKNEKHHFKQQLLKLISQELQNNRISTKSERVII
jgi:3,4-dihydroxy 2-butanone 4-phosphate synthase/GTP cyclohydrolase II